MNSSEQPPKGILTTGHRGAARQDSCRHINQCQDMVCVNSMGLSADQPPQHSVPKLTHTAAKCQAIQQQPNTSGTAVTELSDQNCCVHVAMDSSNVWQTLPCNKSL